MMATTELWIERAILRAIEIRVGEMLAEEEAKAVERVRERLRAEVASVAASVFKEINMERFGADLRITIKHVGGAD